MPNSISLDVAAAQLARPQQAALSAQQAKKIKADNESTGQKMDGLGKQAHLKNACKELESVFIYHLLKEMRATIPDSGLMGGEGIKDMYNHMTDSQLAKELSQDGGIGLSDILFRQLNRLTADGDNNEKGKID